MVSVPTKVEVASGNDHVLVVAVVTPETWNCTFLVLSDSSMIYVVESDRDLFVRVTVAEFLVESEVLSTLPRPTSPLTIPVVC